MSNKNKMTKEDKISRGYDRVILAAFGNDTSKLIGDIANAQAKQQAAEYTVNRQA